ncbi:MAG: YceD family protein [Bifidobacteriaceae bacterium]|jgi:uncharacterized protein|nr:YceD family protein [Bifidobacteriaceae bacterium]
MPDRTATDAPQLTVSVKELSRRPGTSRELSITFPAPPGLGTAVIGVPEGETVWLDLLVESVLEGVLATGTVTARAQGECVRCLGEVNLPLDVTFQELFVYPERADAAREAGDTSDGEDRREVVDDKLDLNTAVRDGIVLALPFGPVCRDDCPGLCAECGERLEDDPEHYHVQTDPRWAVLEDLLEDEREEA